MSSERNKKNEKSRTYRATKCPVSPTLPVWKGRREQSRTKRNEQDELNVCRTVQSDRFVVGKGVWVDGTDRADETDRTRWFSPIVSSWEKGEGGRNGMNGPGCGQDVEAHQRAPSVDGCGLDGAIDRREAENRRIARDGPITEPAIRDRPCRLPRQPKRRILSVKFDHDGGS